MKKFGSFDDVYHAKKAYDAYCDGLENGCEDCKYDLLSDMTGVSCIFFWVLDNCFKDNATPCKKKASIPSETEDEKFKKRILSAFRNLMDVMGGKKPSESHSEFSERKCGVLMDADELIGELEVLTTKEN